MSTKLEHEKKVITPIGIARYPHLITPDEYEGSLDYKTGLILDPLNNQEHADFVAAIDEAVAAQFEAGKAELNEGNGKQKALAKQLEAKAPYEPELDDETGEETGRIILKCKSKAAGVSKGKPWERKIPVFDAKKKQIKHGTVDIWGGSELRLELVTNCYTAPGLKLAGVAFYISAVQVITLNTAGSASGGNGFGVEEGWEDDGESASFGNEGEAQDSNDSEDF
jgi:hypothetical protein